MTNPSSLGTRPSSSLSTSENGIPSPSKKPKLAHEAPDSKMQGVATGVPASSSLPFFPPIFSPPKALYAGPSLHIGRGRSQPKAVAAAAPPPAIVTSSYKSAAQKIALTWDSEGTTFKTFSIVKQEPQCIEPLGQGDSFQCFKMGDRVVKLFIGFFDTTKKPRLSRGETDQSHYDMRMDTLKTNFDLCQRVNIPCAPILNPDRLKDEGYVLQKRAFPLELWSARSGALSNNQMQILSQFLKVLDFALTHSERRCWDLAPKNFGLADDKTTINLLDFTDRPLDQWRMFPQAIRAWANDNPIAQLLITSHLQCCLTDPVFAQVKDPIAALIKNLNW